LLGVNVDDNVKNAADLSAKLGVNFPVLLDTDKKVSRLYDLNSMPSTMVIDRSGKVRFVHRGYQDGYEDLYDKQIRDLLKE
jgi:peroxiredoxin